MIVRVTNLQFECITSVSSVGNIDQNCTWPERPVCCVESMSAVRSCLAATDTVSTLLFSMVVEPLTVTPNSTVLSPANAFDGTFTVAVSEASLLELCLLFTVTEDCERKFAILLEDPSW